MGATLRLFKNERHALPFFAALAQSALGNGAGAVALLVLAYDRFRSPWAVGLVLAADLLPAMFLGPLLGAVADRFSRKFCVIAADVLRAFAFGGVAVVDDFVAMVLLAALAGLGTALFRPASQAAVPGLVSEPSVPAALATLGAVEDVGFTVGPALAAALLLVVGADGIVAINGATFAVSALILARIRFGEQPSSDAPDAGQAASLMLQLLHDTRDGMRTAAGTPGLRPLIFISALTLLFCGLFNVGELLFAEQELGTSGSGFSLLVTVFGIGFFAGSMRGASGGELGDLKRGYEAGIALLAVGFIGCALAPSLPVALLTFAASGLGNGLLLVYERSIIQRLVPDEVLARVYGLKDALTAWAFGLAYLTGGALIAIFGVRTFLLGSGVGAAFAAAAAVVAFYGRWDSETEATSRSAGGLHRIARRRLARKDRPDRVAVDDRGLPLLDDLHQGGHH